ncbi:hypothetical protein LTR47_009933 [Exophiala xenobiotica]|nr:hypothetical protein LTR47_009933 [Exophiala xenobiotica]KAK5250322.1 hypothetical protein LTS06_004900 [Exophiala xenobiotica]KAK5284255.1 hypothetical protein LTR40_000533 [Exophiala xenobiotica]KAK5345781.1 hypothetical protein LTR61_010482 [Exophiala xenobiotica]KAK5359188.1 hypothetical protein LTR11_010616 [Exophiala xenobiotica]
MNDPGLNDPMGNAAEEARECENQNGDEEDINQEQEDCSYLIPTRWWCASTAIPLLAGTFGPVANAFSVCALATNWRVYVPPGESSEHGIDVSDPIWLLVVNAISLAFALIANLSLLLNMARRLRSAIAQPVTIFGFWIASVVLIVLICLASTSHFHLRNGEDRALTGAYYYAIFAAGSYQFISYLMCVTAYGAHAGHYSMEFKLTRAQRTLMLQTILFLVYQHLWALAYSHIEGWKYLDTVYWADFTSLTIGIGGSYVPTTYLGRFLLVPFALGGIVILGLLVGSIRTLVLDRGKHKVEFRMMEKTRQRLVYRIAVAIEKQDNAPKRRPNCLHIYQTNKTITQALLIPPESGGMPERTRRLYEFEAMRRV